VSGDPAAAVDPLTRVLSTAAPLSAVHWAGAMSDELAVEYRTASFALFLSLAFGAAALFLAGIGIFAILAHTVARRVPEFALRLALGATPALVRVSVLRSGLIVVLAGCVIGGLVALAATAGLRQILYEVRPTDPVAFAAAIITLLGVALLACWLPARRAAAVNPMETLGRE
jgi:ABC-type antimicrobial peptide transport system permease subunit